MTAAPAEIRHGMTRKEISRLPGAVETGLKTQGITVITHCAAREQAVDLAGKLERALGAAEGVPTRFDPVYDRCEKDEKEAQKRLDRPDPYDAVYRKCPGWKWPVRPLTERRDCRGERERPT